MSRLSIKQMELGAYKAMLSVEQFMGTPRIPPTLWGLIKIRASQINGCAYCIDMHTLDAIKIGESPRRIFALPAWKESPLFTEEERAVLQLTEEVTLISEAGVRDETYGRVLKFYGENGLAQIIMHAIIINSWNRIAVSTKQVFGQP